MKLSILLTFILTVTTQAQIGVSSTLQESSPPGAAAQDKSKVDEIARMLERVKSRSTAERREAIDQLAEAGDLRAVEPVIAALKDQEGDVRASATNALGQLGDSWIVCSETCALDLIGATYVRDVEPGEVLIISDGGFRSVKPFPPASLRPIVVRSPAVIAPLAFTA